MLSECKKQMSDAFSTGVAKNTLDECPMAYKSMDAIVGNIDPTAGIDKVIKPIFNFKTGEE